MVGESIRNSVPFLPLKVYPPLEDIVTNPVEASIDGLELKSPPRATLPTLFKEGGTEIILCVTSFQVDFAPLLFTALIFTVYTPAPTFGTSSVVVDPGILFIFTNLLLLPLKLIL